MNSSFCNVFSAAAVAVAVSPIFVDAEQANLRPTVPVEVSVKVGSASYQAKSEGTCTHAPRASIYGIVSEQWTVRHEEDGRSVQLTLWKPADGSAQMFSLSVSGTANATISTVRGGQVSGSGSVKLEPSGKGGIFSIDAKAKAGETINGTLKCAAFMRAFAEGGD